MLSAVRALPHTTEYEWHSKREKKLSVMLLVLLGSLYLTNFSFVLSTLVNFNYDLIAKVIKLAPVIATVYALPSLFYTHYSKPFVALVVALLVLYAWSGVAVFNYHYKEYLKYFIMVCLPCMIAAYALEDYRYCLTGLKYMGIVFAFLSLFILLMKEAGTNADTDYFMAYSYSSSIFTIALFSDAEVRKWCKPLVWVGKVIFIASIILLGARGPLLTILLFLLSKNISSPKRSLLFKVELLIIFSILLLNYDRIFSILNDLAVSFGINSRTLASLSSKNISMSGRENYYGFYINEILSNPFKFRGIASDWDQMGYPHQIFIELCYQFGFIGILASILMVSTILFILLIKKYDDPFAQTCDVFFLGIGIYTLFLSNSLWKSLQFWMWLGYMFNTRKGITRNASYRNQLL